MKNFIALSLFLLIFTGCATEKADLILLNGKIATVYKQVPRAQAIAIRGDRILAVGEQQEIEKLKGSATKVIDLQGRLAIPGFIESHAHFMSLGYAKMRLDLSAAHTWKELIEMVKEAAAKAEPGEWILGRGWHQEKWRPLPKKLVEGYPVHEQLSAATPDNPVLLTHASGHAVLANALAMQKAGINNSTPDPDGRQIVRDKQGRVTGIFLENAEEPLWTAYEEYKKQLSGANERKTMIRAFRLATQECLSNGVTSFHDAGEPFSVIDFLKEMADKDKLFVRLWVMLGEDNAALRQRIKEYRLIGYANNFLTVRAIKRYMDGALGSRGAWMLEPYSDDPSTSGLNTTPLAVLEETVKIAAENDFQLCIHAIGDRANRETLDLYERTFKQFPQNGDRRWRVEHAQHLSAQDIPRFAQLGVIAAMQGIHCTSDGPWVVKRIGRQRAEEGAYVWQKLWQNGATVCNGTDAPVEHLDPIANYYALVTRRLPDGSRFFPDQALNREQALQAYTINGAYAAFEEDIKGSLTPGKLADIVVLSQDILTVPEEKIPETKVDYTIIGGKVVFKRGNQ
ncbi:MAG TPA: amidohydrolase [Caldithrix abyssi]|uniref:Amidohydrolase n=1 Tax=Caldithrix abyssi TaxID=187145 RepID=A0A7V4WUQ0_CALAY|nr:amidohydrolase [Caldithrix abyssi]